jgi:hypothetical protein
VPPIQNEVICKIYNVHWIPRVFISPAFVQTDESSACTVVHTKWEAHVIFPCIFRRLYVLVHWTWNGVHELRCIDRSPCVLIVLIREHCLAASNLYSVVSTNKFANKCSSSSPSVPSTLFFPYLVVFHSIRWKHKIKEQERARERGALLLRTVAHHGVCTAACSNVLVLREPGGGS